jgi:diphthamide synthase subunit DPH2
MLIRFGGKNHLEKRSLEDIGYDLEIGRIVDEVRKLGARRILIQMPDGLKHLAPYISERLEKDLSGGGDRALSITLMGSLCAGGYGGFGGGL